MKEETNTFKSEMASNVWVAKLIELSEQSQEIDPDTMKALLDQFPEFTSMVKSYVADAKFVIEQGINSKSRSLEKAYDALNKEIDIINSVLVQPELSFDNKLELLDRIHQITEKICELEEKHGAWLSRNLDKFLYTGLGAGLCLAVTFVFKKVKK